MQQGRFEGQTLPLAPVPTEGSEGVGKVELRQSFQETGPPSL